MDISTDVSSLSGSRNPYIKVALQKGLSNYRLISSGQLLVSGLGAEDSPLPRYVKQFIVDEGLVLAIFESLISPVYVILRSLHRKQFVAFGKSSGMFYGMGDWTAFKHGDPIVLVEGPKDRDAIKDLYPFIGAARTNRLSTKQVITISHLTNKVIILFDNDEHGKDGYYRSKKSLEEAGVSVYFIKQFNKMKDTGELLDLDDLDREIAERYYKQSIERIVGGL